MTRTPPSTYPVTFDETAAPVASVIVLAWRLSTELIDCLRSLSESVDAPSYEVLVVLNGASDDARAVVRDQVRGARIIDLDHNVGFGGGCNAAALQARGEYLVLLNDDAVVSSNWLAELVSAASTAPDSGAIASLLLNTDGTVQEAGCRVLGHAGTMQFGGGMSRAEAESAGLLTDRPIDYGSGAALLIRRDAFTQIGGFDKIYEPAYYEDVDLCFRLRSAGFEVSLHPAAVITHAAGGSTSSDTRFRSFAADRAGSRFLARWSATLSEAPSAEAPLEALCDPSLSTPIDDAPAEVRNPEPTAPIALEISRAYADNLAKQLSVAEERLFVEQKLREDDQDYIESVKLDAAHLRNRLDRLEKGGPLMLLRWRLGILRRRFVLRREMSSLRQRD